MVVAEGVNIDQPAPQGKLPGLCNKIGTLEFIFHEQIKKGGPVTVTVPEMTRFLMSLDAAVDTVFAAVRTGLTGETYVPRMKSALVKYVAEIMIGSHPIEIKYVGIRPGEKIHEILVSEEEIFRTYTRDNFYVISQSQDVQHKLEDLKKAEHLSNMAKSVTKATVAKPTSK